MMLSVKNPVKLVRQVVKNTKGIELVDQWKVYIVVMLLFAVLSGLFALSSVDFFKNKPLNTAGVRSVQLEFDESVFKQQPMEVVEPKVEEKATEKETQSPAKQAQGDWVFDKVRQEWRYEK